MHDSLFDSAWLKWGQAIGHSQALQRDIETRTRDGDADPVRRFRAEYHPNRHGFAVVIDELAPMPVRWQLQLGDIASNYRASLDHLAWALVCRGRTPPDTLKPRQEKGVYFPIFKDRGEYNSAVGRYLPGIRRADAAKIRWCQPYRNGPTVRSRHALAVLSRINTGDKHRAVQPLWAFPSVVYMQVTDSRDCVVHRRSHWHGVGESLQEGAEVAFLRCRKIGPQPQLEMKLKITSTPTVGDRMGLKDWGQWTGVFIFQLLRRFSDQPPSIHELDAELAPLSIGG
jgi:hypothetical protein